MLGIPVNMDIAIVWMLNFPKGLCGKVLVPSLVLLGDSVDFWEVGPCESP
jgi:hypothetical protein